MMCKRFRFVIWVALVVLLLKPAIAPVLGQGSANEGNGDSYRAVISADGRYVAFASDATNLVSGDTNGVADIFVHDRQTGETSRVSVASDGTQANNASGNYGLGPETISADGRYVAFTSSANNLVSGDTNGVADVFVHDRQTGETSRVSVASDGTQANDVSYSSSISADGRYIAFASPASNLVSGDTNNTSDIFVHDRQTGETSRVSIASDGSEASICWGGGSGSALSISADGRFVAFVSSCSNLVTGDTNELSDDIFVHDRQTGVTTRVSVASDGTQADSGSDEVSISLDGRYVVFSSDAGNLVSDDINHSTDVFVHDRQTGETTRVSVASDGTDRPRVSGVIQPALAISADGRYVTFSSLADLASDVGYTEYNVFVHDRQTGETTRVSTGFDGSLPTSGSLEASISADGRYVAFLSGATNLVPGDTNGVVDIFVHDMQTGETTRVSVPSSEPPQLGCDLTGVNFEGIGPFPPFPAPPIDFEFFQYQLTYKFELNAKLCPDTPFSVAIDEDPSFVVRSPSGETKLSQRGELETDLDIAGTHQGIGITVAPAPPSITLVNKWHYETQSLNYYALEEESRLEHKITVKPPPTQYVYIVAVAGGVAYLVHEAAVTAVELAPAAEELLLLAVPDISPSPTTGFLNIVALAANPQLVSPGQYTIEDLKAIFGADFISFSAIGTLAIDQSTVVPGQPINYHGEGFIPNGRAYLYFGSVNTLYTGIQVETQADGQGNIAGLITVPMDAPSGFWLIAAMDIDQIHAQLQALANGQSTALSYYLLANEIQVGSPPPHDTLILVGISLQGRPAAPDARWSIPLHVVVAPQTGGAPVFDQQVTTDLNGQIILNGLTPGDYHLWVKGDHTLAVAANLTVVAGANSASIGVLREGDTDGNNVVNLLDFSLLAASFGKQTGNVGFDARADFNGDGVVNLTDFSLLASNFGQSGDT